MTNQIDQKEQKTKIQDIHRRKYFAAITLLPELQQQRAKEYFQIIITFAALIVAIVFAIEPTLTTIVQLNKEVSDAKQVNSALQTKITALSQLNIQYNQLQPILPQIYTAIPQTEEAQSLAMQIQALAFEHNVVATALTIQADPIAGASLGTKDISFTLTVTGAYADLRAFLQDSIDFQRIILPTSITMSNQLGNTSLSLLMSGKAYFIP